MDATGHSMFSALPLMVLSGLFWWLQKFSRKDIGLTLGDLPGTIAAVAYPLLVLGAALLLACLAGATNTAEADWSKTALNIALSSTVGIVGVLLTEELFFRGWLWAALQRAGLSGLQVLAWSTLVFTAWHISAVSLDTGFDLPVREIPIYLVNVTLLGLAWGILRLATGSVLIAAVCHAVWNAIDYPLFGFGEKVGELGITQTHIYGPETGLVGIVLNGLAVWALWVWLKKRTGNMPAT